MKFNHFILALLLFGLGLKAQEKILISETDSIKIFETYLSIHTSENIFPMFYDQGIIYASIHKSKNYKLYYSDLKSNALKIKIGPNFVWGPVAVFENEIYFSRYSNRSSSNGIFNVTIYKGILENLKVSKVKKLDISNKEYSYSHPAISKDGNFMVIVTNEKGMFHLLQLKRNNEGTWERGDIIYITQENIELLNPTFYDENTIYFSANSFNDKVQKVEKKFENGKLVYADVFKEEGDFDIYKITKENGTWLLPVKVPEFNSEFDDLGVIFKTKTSGYLTTFRYNNSDNIYYFELKK